MVWLRRGVLGGHGRCVPQPGQRWEGGLYFSRRLTVVHTDTGSPVRKHY